MPHPPTAPPESGGQPPFRQAGALEEYVDALEQAFAALGDRAPDTIDPRDFAPPPDQPCYAEAVVEVCRVHLERTWQPADPERLERYRRWFPDVWDEPERWRSLVFEDDRLRRYHERIERVVAVPAGPSGDEPLAHSWSTQHASAWQELSQLRPEWTAAAEGRQPFPLPGTTFAGFLLGEELGRGAFARVYLAEQAELARRRVVLKVSVTADGEPQQLAKLRHTNITPIHSVHHDGSFQAVCMPFLGRGTLADLLAGRRAGSSTAETARLVSTWTQIASSRTGQGKVAQRRPAQLAAAPEPTAPGSGEYVDAVVWVVAQVASGLAHAHDQGILHCDLKPANILLADDGAPVLLDFNTARDCTRVGGCAALIGGTLPYMSPEQIRAFHGGGEVDARSDVYSLGLVLYELLTGERAFPEYSGSLDEVLPQMVADRRHHPIRPRNLNPQISPSLQAIVQKCLAFAPAERYATARQFHEDLVSHLEHRPLRYVREPSLAERFRKWSLRHPLLSSHAAVLTAVISVLAILGAAWWSQRERLANQEAARQFAAAMTDSPVLWLDAAGNPLDPELREEFQRRAGQLYSQYQVLEREDWLASDLVRRLPADEQRQLREQLSGVLYLDAELFLHDAQVTTGSRREAALQAASLRHRAGSRVASAADEQPEWTSQRRRIEEPDLNLAGKTNPLELSLRPGISPERLWTVSAAILHDRQRETEPLLRQLVRHDPRQFAAWCLLGNCLAGRGDWSESEECFTACIVLRPELNVGWFHRGLVRLARRDFAGARDDFSAVLERQPGMWGAHVNRALAQRGLGNVAAAIADLTAAIEGGSPETRLWLLRARYREAAGDVTGAAADRREWLGREPADAASWVARGTERLQSDPAGAEADLREALRLHPRSRTALQNLAHLLSEQLGRPAEAVELLDQALLRQPDDAVLLGSRGVLRARLGRDAEALRDAAEACRVAPSDGFAWYQAACVESLVSPRDPNRKGTGIRHLARALALRADLAAVADSDPDVAELRIDPRYSAVRSEFGPGTPNRDQPVNDRGK